MLEFPIHSSLRNAVTPVLEMPCLLAIIEQLFWDTALILVKFCGRGVDLLFSPIKYVPISAIVWNTEASRKTTASDTLPGVNNVAGVAANGR